MRLFILLATLLMAPAAVPAGAAQTVPPAGQAQATVPAGQSANGTTAATGAATGTATADAGYILGPGDIVEVTVVGRDDYRNRVRVQTDGSILLALIGRLPASGRTSLQLSEDVRAALRKGGYYANPQVSVEIASYASRYVTVLGEVGNPGLVPIDRAYRVSEVLARVGGVRESGSDVVTLTRAGGEPMELSMRALATGGAAEDPLVNAGDKLFVATAPAFYIYGQVAAPGSYRLEPEMSLRKALARGGGLTASGSEKRVRVYRAGQEIKKFELNAPIAAGDVVVVGERLF